MNLSAGGANRRLLDWKVDTPDLRSLDFSLSSGEWKHIFKHGFGNVRHLRLALCDLPSGIAHEWKGSRLMETLDVSLNQQLKVSDLNSFLTLFPNLRVFKCDLELNETVFPLQPHESLEQLYIGSWSKCSLRQLCFAFPRLTHFKTLKLVMETKDDICALLQMYNVEVRYILAFGPLLEELLHHLQTQKYHTKFLHLEGYDPIVRRKCIPLPSDTLLLGDPTKFCQADEHSKHSVQQHAVALSQTFCQINVPHPIRPIITEYLGYPVARCPHCVLLAKRKLQCATDPEERACKRRAVQQKQ